VATVKILLDARKSNMYKIDLNAQGREKRTPLHVAATQGYYTVVKLLIDADGVGMDAKDFQGFTAAGEGHTAET
jgi:ankyrin repeat protein